MNEPRREIVNLNEVREKQQNCNHTFNQSEYTCDNCGIDIEDTE